jgi:hypothetical protein
VNSRVIRLAIAIAGSGIVILTGQQPSPPAPPRVFTSTQAEAGREAYRNTCGKCHTYNLLGRNTADEGLPPVDSLRASYQEFVRKTNHVPPLAGKVFLSRWGQKTTAELIARFEVTASDKSFEFEGMTADTTVDITAYVLEVNGAKSGTQALTRTTDAVVNSLLP